MLLKSSILLSVLAAAPQAKAEGSLDPVAMSTTKSYDKAALQQSAPVNPNPDLAARAFSGTIFFLNHLGKGLEEPGRRQRVVDLGSKAPPKESFGTHSNSGIRAAVHETPDINGMRSMVGLDLQRLLKKEAKDAPAVVAVVKMAKVDIKPGSMFDATPAAAPAKDPLRYGLVVTHIEPDSSSPPMASLGDSMEEMRYAGHARVDWTVEPISEVSRRQLYQGSSYGPSYGESAPVQEQTYSLKLPSPNFTTNATAEGSDDVTKVDARSLPGMRFELNQQDGYYSMTYRTSGQGKKIGVQHTVKAPVAGTVKVGRRFDDHFHLLETAAYDVLYQDHLPSLNLHQMHADQRFSADLSTRIGASHTVGITARGEAGNHALTPAERARAYGMNYSHSF